MKTSPQPQPSDPDPCPLPLCCGTLAGEPPTCGCCGAVPDAEVPDGLWCAECGTGDAATYVVTFTNGQDDRSGRTEVCLPCHEELQS